MKKTPKKTKSVSRKTKPKTPKSIVVVSPVDPSVKLHVASELADDSMVESELMGEVLPFFVYQFNQKGSTVTGLSTKGVNETVRRLNRDKKSGYNIRINPQYIKIEHNIDQEKEKGVQVSVYAENMLDGNSAWGVKFEPYYKDGRNGRYKNEFAVEKALAKAERNAKRKLIPEPVVVKMIEKLMAEDPKTVKQIEAPSHTARVIQPTAPKASTPEELKALVLSQINQSKDIDYIIELDKRTQESEKFDAIAKEQIRHAASKRVDQLQG